MNINKLISVLYLTRLSKYYLYAILTKIIIR